MDLLEMPGVVYCEFKKGEYIIHQGEKLDSIYYLVNGSCFRSTITNRGDEIIYGVKESFNFAQSLLGVLILYSDGVSQCHFIARSDCSCYKIPKKTFFKFVKNKPQLLTEILHMAMAEYRKLNSFFHTRHEGKTANRLCKLLLENAQSKGDKLLVNKEYNNIKISQFLGVHEVTVSRILRVLKKEGIINRKNGCIYILNQKKLALYANSEKEIKY